MRQTMAGLLAAAATASSAMTGQIHGVAIQPLAIFASICSGLAVALGVGSQISPSYD